MSKKIKSKTIELDIHVINENETELAAIAEGAHAFSSVIYGHSPISRERIIAFDKLQEAMWWACLAVTNNR